MALKRWTVNEAGVTELLGGPGVAGQLEAVAQAGLAHARAHAPMHTGRYRDSLILTGVRREAGGLVAGFGSNAPHWHWVEFGSINNRPHRVLGAAAEAVADRVEHL